MRHEADADVFIVDSQPWDPCFALLAMLIFLAGTELALYAEGLTIVAHVLLLGVLPLFGECPVRLARRYQLLPDRRAGTLCHGSRGLMGYACLAVPRSRLDQIVVQEKPGPNGSTFRLGVILDSGPGPAGGPMLFTQAFSTGPAVPRTAEALTAWLDRRPAARAG